MSEGENANEDSQAQQWEAYFAKKKAKGKTLAEIRALWMVSKVRTQIIESLPSPERRRRRFV